jgi:glutathione S-transferase
VAPPSGVATGNPLTQLGRSPQSLRSISLQEVSMPKLHGANASPFVRKVRVVLAEKNLPYELVPLLPINPSPEFRRMSPLGKIPVYEDGEHVLPDSSVISAYLERAHPTPALYPKEPYEYGRALWFEEYGDTALLAEIGAKIFFPLVVGPRFLGREPNRELAEQTMRETLPPLLDYLESQLGGDGWIAGRDFSIGDIGIATQFVNLRHAGFGVDAARWPKLAGYVGRVHARPSFRALIEEEAPLFSDA